MICAMEVHGNEPVLYCATRVTRWEQWWEHMREVAFVRRHQARWQQFEQEIKHTAGADPDRLAELFIELTDDLAYARAQYPKSQTTQYLNQLTANVYGMLYKNRRERASRIVRFWMRDVPLTMLEARRAILVSAMVLLIGGAMGFVSGLYDDTLARAVLGDGYVDMTIRNIERGDPMAVYKDPDAVFMFVRICWNNMYVSLRVTAMGVLTPVMPIMMLLYNAVMLGVFHGLFTQHGELGQALLTVWVHGAFEISAIVVAGAAGITIGNGLLFPGTYTRQQALVRAIRRAGIIIAGLMPFIIVAAVLESFVTRWTSMPLLLNLFIILGSFGSIWWYVLVLPKILLQRGVYERNVRTA